MRGIFRQRQPIIRLAVLTANTLIIGRVLAPSDSAGSGTLLCGQAWRPRAVVVGDFSRLAHADVSAVARKACRAPAVIGLIEFWSPALGLPRNRSRYGHKYSCRIFADRPTAGST